MRLTVKKRRITLFHSIIAPYWCSIGRSTFKTSTTDRFSHFDFLGPEKLTKGSMCERRKLARKTAINDSDRGARCSCLFFSKSEIKQKVIKRCCFTRKECRNNARLSKALLRRRRRMYFSLFNFLGGRKSHLEQNAVARNLTGKTVIQDKDGVGSREERIALFYSINSTVLVLDWAKHF